MKSKFIFSFDCEGKWGIADRGQDRLSEITNKKLIGVYHNILDLMDKYDFAATFGFVGALCLDEVSLKESIIKDKDSLIFNKKKWLEPVFEDVDNLDGWSAPELIKMVIDREKHHICSHGGYHIPYSEELTNPNAIRADIKLIKKVELLYNQKIDTIIFPRNVIGHLLLLEDSNISYYRNIDNQEKKSGLAGKFIRVWNEYFSYDLADTTKNYYRKNGKMKELSAAKFFNAKIGIRKYIPSSSTRKRIDDFLKYASKEESIIHFYSHPHNFITDPTLFETFEYLLSKVKQHEAAGKIKVITMREEKELTWK